MNISTWNIRGLNQHLKWKELKLFLIKHRVIVCGFLETRVKENKAPNVLKKVVRGWNTYYNYPMDHNGRIWLFWQPHMQVNILMVKEQFIHYYIVDDSTLSLPI